MQSGPWYPHHESLAALERSASSGCELCGLVIASWEINGPKRVPPGEDQGEILFHMGHQSSISFKQIGRGIPGYESQVEVEVYVAKGVCAAVS